ncbi:MAG: DUF1289 domain-containing protein [Hydrogenophaga sp.]|jgi:predicted Fe-S protein YdhL (DUF1289 family)|uniref:DUF1289 domain-containing protein n=1 Tax=Hydrogenophaga sp. TaxID=1904254 RepID=UPI002715F830|nr:DUF1289 domain-containing protein [Hydrogenophaga sp.]MDO9250346.1 DUF1289 domain-containing protein [Hydrogenophaga sp.]MDP2405762.1 DUF1289 domain-containing protein [Hydrogenophaga sp.]MDP3324593.1 DUF1289 domain-containing protein [Hydrogenophaga sp.]MDZ4176981.1 DUF1289 domain-containing protein [Hydrogenophaga sp.]
MNEPLINLRDARERHPGPGVPSPCVSICELDERSSSCKGCYRTLPEIATWSALADAEKLVIWERIEARQTTR